MILELRMKGEKLLEAYELQGRIKEITSFDIRLKIELKGGETLIQIIFEHEGRSDIFVCLNTFFVDEVLLREKFYLSLEEK